MDSNNSDLNQNFPIYPQEGDIQIPKEQNVQPIQQENKMSNGTVDGLFYYHTIKQIIWAVIMFLCSHYIKFYFYLAGVAFLILSIILFVHGKNKINRLLMQISVLITIFGSCLIYVIGFALVHKCYDDKRKDEIQSFKYSDSDPTSIFVLAGISLFIAFNMNIILLVKI